MTAPASGAPPLWPDRVLDLCREIRRHDAPPARETRQQLWLLLRDALMRFLRYGAGRMPAVARDDLEDLASEKALDLLRRAESGAWTPDGRKPHEVAAYVASVARNGLISLARQSRRVIPMDPLEADSPLESTNGTGPSPVSPSLAVETREFVVALAECVEKLAPRSRRVWFLRAYYEMPSREIASDPSVRMNPAHVDVVMQRARESLRGCLSSRGFAAQDAPRGAFVHLWEQFAAMGGTVPSEEEGARVE